MSASTVALVDAIYAKLISDQSGSSFYTAVGGRIHEAEARYGEDLPHAVFSVVNDANPSTFTKSRIDAAFTVEVRALRSAGARAARQIADKLITLLHESSVTITGFSGGKVEIESRGTLTFDDDSIAITVPFRVWANEN